VADETSAGRVRCLFKLFRRPEGCNFAVAGDTTQGLLWVCRTVKVRDKTSPKAIMLMIGTNNTGGNSGAEIAEGVGADVAELRKDFPDAKILLLAIFPRGGSPSDPNRIRTKRPTRSSPSWMTESMSSS